ncbi:prolyl 4-hydroxylase subunit alpha-2 [Drosophila subobscura]|uniref:prolyl 4-hydroxylase subunit alpha-2 n=1 Tax=Drosophila subobscura TaxID=7241 RepID=UPI00155AC427|nr:prolyl 4-hydroxylase subunit alpha-2 [Drosophila subobscura]
MSLPKVVCTFICLSAALFGMILGEEEYKEVLIYTTSNRALSELREMENSYVEHLTSYVKSLQKKVDTLRKYINSVALENLESEVSRVQYVANPLNSLGLLRRAHEDWPKWLNYIKEQQDVLQMGELVALMPHAVDMNEALMGMERIERFYDLRAYDMVNGQVAGRHFDTRMNAPECLMLADFMYNRTEYTRAAEWYRLTWNNIKLPLNPVAREFYRPNREEVRKRFLISRLQEGSIDHIKDYLEELEQHPAVPLVYLKPKPAASVIERGCRGEFPPPPQLVCRYNHTTTPFLRLAPLKEEEISLDPLIWLYHDVISDSEIAALTANLTYEDMTQGYTDNYTTVEKERLFHVKVFEGSGEKLDRDLVNRMEDISGLNAGDHTHLARMNYGLGSHFPEHGDYSDIKANPELVEEGDRLVTFLFYMTDVPLGGATIFPKINLTIQPKKGSALFWYNIHNDWEPHLLTRHGVCPMIDGNRWILTKSLMAYDQMFVKLCLK